MRSQTVTHTCSLLPKPGLTSAGASPAREETSLLYRPGRCCHLEGTGGPRAVPPLVEILAEHGSQTGSGGAWLGPEELWARAQGKWGQGVPPLTNHGRVPSGQLPKTPPRSPQGGRRARYFRVVPASFSSEPLHTWLPLLEITDCLTGGRSLSLRSCFKA